MSEDFFSGPLLAIDHGLKVIGLAISRTGHLASPLMLIHRTSKARDFARINEIIEQESIHIIIVGLPPVPPDFVGHTQADTVRKWTKQLKKAISVPVYFWEEGLSTVNAEALLAETGKRRPDRVDAHAAAVILQSCLDALREGHPDPELA